MGSMRRWQPAARFAIQVDGQALPIRHRLFFRQIRQVGVHPGRGRRYLLGEELVPDEQPPGRRGRLGGLARQHQEAAVSQHARTAGIRWVCHLREVLVGGRQAVEPGEIRIHEGIVGREEFHEVPIVPDQVIEQSPRLLDHRRGDVGVEFAEPPAIARGLQHPVESHPLGQEFLHRDARAGIVEHAPRRGLDMLGRRQLPLSGRAQQVVGGRRVPEEIREAAGDREGRIGAARPPLDAEEKMRRLEHGLDHHRGACVEVPGAAGLLEAQARISAHLVFRQGAAERPEAEPPDERVDGRGISRRPGSVRDQSVLVAAPKGRAGEPLGRLAVGLGLDRRHALPFKLVLEAVDEVLLGEAAGGLDLIAEEVAHRVVVLAVRQAAHGRAPPGRGRSDRASRSRARRTCSSERPAR